MEYNMTRKAFTLIELLVVVAIIGILATVVVVNLSGAQNKARDSKVKADLNTVQKAASLYYLENANYSALNCAPLITPVCISIPNSGNDTNITSIINAAKDIASVSADGLVINATASDYRAFAKLPSTLGSSSVQRASVDGSGVSITIPKITPPIYDATGLRNGGFDGDLINWIPDTGGGTRGTLETPTVGGNKVLQITSFTGGATGSLQTSQVVTGKTYLASFWAKTVTAGSTATIKSSGALSYWNDNQWNAADVWTKKSYTFTATAATQNYFGIYLTSPGAPVYVDNVSVEELP